MDVFVYVMIFTAECSRDHNIYKNVHIELNNHRKSATWHYIVRYFGPSYALQQQLRKMHELFQLLILIGGSVFKFQKSMERIIISLLKVKINLIK